MKKATTWLMPSITTPMPCTTFFLHRRPVATKPLRYQDLISPHSSTPEWMPVSEPQHYSRSDWRLTAVPYGLCDTWKSTRKVIEHASDRRPGRDAAGAAL